MATRMDFFSIPRRFFEPGAFKFEPYSKREALLDLIQMAAYEDGTSLVGGLNVKVKRGQLIASVRFLAKRWGWSNDRTLRTLTAFESEHFIERDPNTTITTISILNYDTYQRSQNTNQNTIANTNDGDSRTNTKNKEKEIKNEKEKVSKDTIEKDAVIDALYAIYPTTCPVSGRSTGKCSKNKKQIATLLKEKDAATIERTMRQYVADCKNHQTFIKNFSTFLNNFPEEDSLFTTQPQQPTARQPETPPQKKSPEVIAIEAMHAGVKDASIVIHAIRCAWEGIPEEKVNSALRNAGYIR